MKLMRGVIASVVALLMGSFCYADEIKIPFSVYMDDFKSECKAQGFDIYGTKESHGFVEDKAGEFIVFTYKRATPEQMDIVKNATWKFIRK